MNVGLGNHTIPLIRLSGQEEPLAHPVLSEETEGEPPSSCTHLAWFGRGDQLVLLEPTAVKEGVVTDQSGFHEEVVLEWEEKDQQAVGVMSFQSHDREAGTYPGQAGLLTSEQKK